MKTFNIPFTLDIYMEDNFVQEETHTFKLSEKEVRQVAEAMDAIGGYPVEMCSLTRLEDRIIEDYIMYLTQVLPEDTDWDSLRVEIPDEMPEELVLAAESYIREKGADIAYYIQKDDEEIRRETAYAVSAKAFRDIMTAAASVRTEPTDFDQLRVLFPESYKEIRNLVLSNASVDCMTQFGREYPVVLKEFPSQVYLSL